jgi:hypothetical protein
MPTAGGMMLKAHVALVATAMPLLVRLIPLKRLLRLLEPPRWMRCYRNVDIERIAAVVEARLARPRMMVRRACLRKGLTLYHFLRLSGRPAELVFGVFPSADAKGRMHGHCWVSVDGRAVSEPAAAPVAVVLRKDGADNSAQDA